MAVVNRGWTGRFSLAGFCVTLSVMAACLGQATEKVPRRRPPRQATEEEGAGSRVAGLWSPWSAWSACSQPCGLGVSERTRACRSPYGPDPWPQRAGAAPQRGPPPQLPRQRDRGHPTFPLHPEGGTGPALSFPGGPAVLPLHRQAQPPHAPYGTSAQRHTRHQGLPAGEPPPLLPPLAPSQILGAPHPGRRRDPAPFHEAARPPRPRGGQEFPGHASPPRPPHSASAMPPRHRGSLPLFKPLRQDGPRAGLSPDRPTRHGGQADGGRPGGGAPLTLDDPQAAQRSRVRETIKPGKYGYGKVPFALPLHKDPPKGAASRSKRDSGDHAGQLSALPPPPPPRPPSKKARRKVTRSSSHEEAARVWEKDPLTSGVDLGAHDKPGQPRPAEGAAQTHVGVEGGREGSLGQGHHASGHGGGLKRGDPAEARSTEEPLPEKSAVSPGPSGGEGAQERGSVATGGVSSLPRTPPPSGPPPQGQAELHLTHQVLRDHRVAPKWQDPATGRSPWDAPEWPPPRPESRSVSGHASHPPQGQARIRHQRQNQPRTRGGYGSRQSHSLFAEPPVAPHPSEPDVWLLHRGQGAPEARGRAGAEGPQWNLYYPGTETFHCEGESKQFKACRQEPCPADHPDPRAVQCAAYNDQEFMGRFYQWEPFTDVRGSQRCELNCRPIGHRFYVRHTEKVRDGIPCEASSQDICVAGQCLTPGCDGILGSNRTLDSCGVCGGDHTTCKLVVGNFSETDVPIGYHRILEIPAGATRIHIREMTRSPNYLALRSHNGKSIINGNWAVNPPGRYEAAGTVFVYSRPGNDRQEGESLMADGPTVEPIDVYMIFQQDNPGVSYQFFLSSAQPEDSHREQPPSRPEFGALTLVSPGSPAESPLSHIVRPASAEGRHQIPAGPPVSSGQSGRTRAVAPPPPASGGHSGRSPGTLQRHVRVPPLLPPPPHHSEGSHDYYWRRIGNTACSATCGKGFWQSVYRCISWASQEEVGEEHCHLIPKPIVQEEVCNTEPCPAYWDAGDWSACSKSCGLGTQHRQVLCRQIYANRSTVVHPQRCGHLEKPNATQACQVQVCSHWEIHANWSSCSVLCGTGHRTRHVRCVSNEGTLLRDSDCPSNNRPETSEACDVGPCVRTWFYSDWSNTCSAECGTGIQRRSVVCLSSDADGEAEENCAGAKPAEMRACSGGPCRRVARWYSGPWSTCSSDCGTGTQRRDVICVSKLGTEFNVTEASECAHLEKPPSLQPCAGTSCKARWFSTAWSACSRSCVGGVQVREVQCLTPNRTLTHLCPPDLKPAQKRPCNTQPCLPELGKKPSPEPVSTPSRDP
uniref:ADAMTS-like protein 4 isoform X2 n=1 Tax=Pogona vitticeps TaxID=103695 RepID=A0ABM5F3Z8_9SAUR